MVVQSNNPQYAPEKFTYKVRTPKKSKKRNSSDKPEESPKPDDTHDPQHHIWKKRKTIVSQEELFDMVDLPIDMVAKHLTIGVTLLKKICRYYGIKRWPHRKFAAIAGKIYRSNEILMEMTQEHSDEILKISKYALTDSGPKRNGRGVDKAVAKEGEGNKQTHIGGTKKLYDIPLGNGFLSLTGEDQFKCTQNLANAMSKLLVQGVGHEVFSTENAKQFLKRKFGDKYEANKSESSDVTIDDFSAGIESSDKDKVESEYKVETPRQEATMEVQAYPEIEPYSQLQIDPCTSYEAESKLQSDASGSTMDEKIEAEEKVKVKTEEEVKVKTEEEVKVKTEEEVKVKTEFTDQRSFVPDIYPRNNLDDFANLFDPDMVSYPTMKTEESWESNPSPRPFAIADDLGYSQIIMID